MKKLIKRMFDFLYQLTPKGKKQLAQQKADNHYYHNALESLEKKSLERKRAKIAMVQSANRVLKKKKIVGFRSGKSIGKSKASQHKVRQVVENKHADQMNHFDLKINKKQEIIHA